MFRLNDSLDDVIEEAKAKAFGNLKVVSPAGNQSVLHLFVSKSTSVPNCSRIEIDFVDRWRFSQKGRGVLSKIGFDTTEAIVKKEDVPIGEEKEWFEILLSVLTVPGVFVTRSNLV